MTYNTADIAAYIVELTERTPINNLTVGYFESAVERKFPGLGIEQLHVAERVNDFETVQF